MNFHNCLLQAEGAQQAVSSNFFIKSTLGFFEVNLRILLRDLIISTRLLI